jgi:uncharacterized protein YidB (DUF937 family)
MGLLDDLLGGMMGGAMGQGGGQRPAGQRPAGPSAGAGGGMGNVLMALLPVVLSMLASRGGGARQAGGGGLGDILGQVRGGGAPRGSAGGTGGDILGELLGRGGAGTGSMGGLGALLEQMQRAGFGDQARSWVGTGQNMPIPPDALDQIFGRGGIDEIAREAGLTPQQTSEGLSELLPEVVDRFTPGGEVPDFDQLTESVDDLRRRLGA